MNTNTFDSLVSFPGCHGWRHDLRGEHGFGSLPFSRRSSSQSVLVRRGCVFYGYDIGWRRGRVVVVNADQEEGDVADVRAEIMQCDKKNQSIDWL